MPDPPVAADVSVKVWGRFALFTRPEAHTERVTYPVMTPSAAVGVLEQIYWRPEFAYRIQAIEVLAPIRTLPVARNEIEDRQGTTPISVEEKRQQRMSTMLKDVSYIIHANVMSRFPRELEDHGNRMKHIASLERRLDQGRCYQQPYLGTRECLAFFARPGAGDRGLGDLHEELGLMLHTIAYVLTGRSTGPLGVGEMWVQRKPSANAAPEWLIARPTPQFFQARLDAGVLHVDQGPYDDADRLMGWL